MGHRKETVAEDIRQILSYGICFDLRDPGLEGITLTHVKLSGDLQVADVLFTLLDDAHDVADAQRALQRARPAMRHMIAEKIKLRRVPELRFHFDEDVAAERRIHDILSHLKQEGEAAAASASPPAPSAEPAPDSAGDDRANKPANKE